MLARPSNTLLCNSGRSGQPCPVSVPRGMFSVFHHWTWWCWLSWSRLLKVPWTARRLNLYTWNSPGKNTGVGSHSLLQGTFPTQGLKMGLLHCRQIFNHLSHQSESEVTQLCPTLSDPMDCSLPGSSVHGVFQQDYWSGLPFLSPGDLPNPGIKPRSPALQTGALPSEPPRKPR